MDSEKVGEVFTTLVGLLKAKSKAFSTNIGKQVLTFTIHREISALLIFDLRNVRAFDFRHLHRWQ